MSAIGSSTRAQEFFAGVGRMAGLEPVAAAISGAIVQKLLGFWVMWHLAGGLEPLIAKRWVSRSWVYKQRSLFHRVMHVEVENYWPEVASVMASERERLAT